MGGDGKWEGGKGKKRGRKHAFKLLCPDVLITSIMGPRGTNKDAMEEETGCKIIFSNRDEFYPGTYFRTLCIYSDEPDPIVTVLERVVEHVVQCGEQELQNPPTKGEGDFVGKEEGTYMIRAAVSVRMSGAIIGPKGANVQAIRDESNAKLFIDKNNFLGHQMLKVLAPPDGLRLALTRVNECVQTEAGTEEFMQWAAIRVFSEDGNGEAKAGKGKEKGKEKGKDKGKEKGKEKGKGKSSTTSGAAGDELHWNEEDGGHDRSRSPYRVHASEDDQAAWQEGGDYAGCGGGCGQGPDVDPGMLQALGATCEEFPEGTLEMEYTVTCELPSQKVSALIGKKGENIQKVRRSTGARIHFEEVQGAGESQQTLLIQGPLLRVYKAHALMMRRYHEADMESAPVAETPSVKQLQEQLEELQRQLMIVQESSGKTKGKGKGKKG